MLVSDKYKFVVAMPTKTGTNTLRAIVEKHKRAGGDVRVLNLLTGEAATRHRIAPPPGKEDYTRYMLVREPKARLVSMYEYLRRKDWEWKAKDILKAEEEGRAFGWTHMLALIAEYRSTDGYFSGGCRKAHGGRPWMWTDRLSEMARYMYGRDMDGSELPWYRGQLWDHTKLIQLEMFASHWGRLLRSHGVEEDSVHQYVVPHRNATPGDDKLHQNPEEYWTHDGAEELAAFILGDDAQELGYIDGRFG